MKTFEQFLSEAQRPAFASQRKIPNKLTPEEKARVKLSRLARENAESERTKQEAERQRKGLPSGTSISPRERERLKAQAAAENEAAKPKPKPQEPTSRPIEPRQLEFKYMRPDKPHIPLSLDAPKPKLPRLPKPEKRPKVKPPKTRQLRLRGT